MTILQTDLTANSSDKRWNLLTRIIDQENKFFLEYVKYLQINKDIQSYGIGVYKFYLSFNF